MRRDAHVLNTCSLLLQCHLPQGYITSCVIDTIVVVTAPLEVDRYLWLAVGIAEEPHVAFPVVCAYRHVPFAVADAVEAHVVSVDALLAGGVALLPRVASYVGRGWYVGAEDRFRCGGSCLAIFPLWAGF